MDNQNNVPQGCPSAEGGGCGDSSACAGCAGFQPVELPHDIKRVIAIASGKGGVGKSSTTAMLAAALTRKGLKVGIMDADITGPSIPRILGLSQNIMGDGTYMLPAETEQGIKAISINLMLEDETAPVVWRGPVMTDILQQFWSKVRWGDLDVLLIDMPPGTGDVPITIFQSIPVDGIIMVTTPQQLSGMIVNKAVGMSEMMEIPVLGVIENMAYYECPDCGKKINLFGSGAEENLVEANGLQLLGKLPILPEISELTDAGKAYEIQNEQIDGIASELMQRHLVNDAVTA